MTISEKVAYLKGLADGLDLDKESTKESKILGVVIDLLEEISYAIEDLEETDLVLSEGLDAVSEDLEDVETLLYDDEDDDFDDFDDDFDDDQFFVIECPNCDEELHIDGSVLDAGQISCPNCSELFALDLVDDDEDEDEE